MAPRDGIERDPYVGLGAHGGHGLMMLICCVPMLVIALVLVATGVVGSSIIVTALLCTAMMAVMMFAMSGRPGHK